MIRFSPRQAVATMILGASALLTAALAGEAAPAPAQAPTQAQAQAVDAPPPKPYVIPAKGIKDYIRKAVEAPRPPEMTVHDAYRKPAELLQLSLVKPGSRVIELSSYGNYWSTLLSNIIGEKGELYMYDHPFALAAAKFGEDFVAKHPNTHFQNVDHNNIEFPKGVDLVLCVMCFHELLLTNVQMDAFLAKLSKAMKPGATFLIVFATARDNMENRDTGTLHRLDPATVRGTVGAAGFELMEDNRLLENHADDKKTKVFSEAEGDLSDRMIYRFRKS